MGAFRGPLDPEMIFPNIVPNWTAWTSSVPHIILKCFFHLDSRSTTVVQPKIPQRLFILAGRPAKKRGIIFQHDVTDGLIRVNAIKETLQV